MVGTSPDMLTIQATNLPRLIACEDSADMATRVNRDDVPLSADTDDAREGTAAHHIASAVLYGHNRSASEWLDRQTPNGVFVTAGMVEYATRYVSTLLARVYAAPPRVHIESSTDGYIQTIGESATINGRADYIAWDAASATLYIDDFKYGFRIVEPEENWTLIWHAIGYVMREQIRPARVIFTIHQPRPHHPDGPVRPWSISGDQLAEYHEFLRAFLEAMGDTLVTGSHCYECPAYAICRAAREAEMNAVDVSHSVALSDEMSNAALGVTLDDIERALQVLETSKKAFTELAAHRAAGGSQIPGRMLEPQYGNRAFKKGVSPGMLAMLTGLPIDKLTVSKIQTPHQVELALKAAGKPDAVVTQFAYRPMIGVKLVKRDISKAAAKAFGST